MSLPDSSPSKRRQITVGLMHIAVGLVFLAIAVFVFRELLP